MVASPLAQSGGGGVSGTAGSGLSRSGAGGTISPGLRHGSSAGGDCGGTSGGDCGFIVSGGAISGWLAMALFLEAGVLNLGGEAHSSRRKISASSLEPGTRHRVQCILFQMSRRTCP